ncbi:MAG: hypothetical protein ACYDGR_12800 [Candidatus Dormibacteria bacterium]
MNEIRVDGSTATEVVGRLRAALGDIGKDPDCVDYQDMLGAAAESAAQLLSRAIKARRNG